MSIVAACRAEDTTPALRRLASSCTCFRIPQDTGGWEVPQGSHQQPPSSSSENDFMRERGWENRTFSDTVCVLNKGMHCTVSTLTGQNVSDEHKIPLQCQSQFSWEFLQQRDTLWLQFLLRDYQGCLPLQSGMLANARGMDIFIDIEISRLSTPEGSVSQRVLGIRTPENSFKHSPWRLK